ncbi:hypothetical protein N9W41_00855, partial [bacterium]|nr:hypothetical protein [bacterium]
SSDELQKFYLDFRPLGIDLGLVASNKTGVGHRSFNEANFFMYSSDGLKYNFELDGLKVKTKEITVMSVDETIELASFLYSAGLHGKKIYDKSLNQLDCKTERKDESGYNYLSKKCVQDKFAQIITENLGNLPNLQAALLGYFSATARDDDRGEEEIINNLLTAINEDTNANVVSHGSILSFYAILQYVEAIMTRFDANADRKLDESELMNAFTQTYSGVLHSLVKQTEGENADLYYFYDDIKKKPSEFKKLMKMIEEDTTWLEYYSYKWYLNVDYQAKSYNEKLKSLFLYIIEKGRLPTGKLDPSYLWWLGNRVVSDVTVDRVQLIKSLTLIISELSKLNEAKINQK